MPCALPPPAVDVDVPAPLLVLVVYVLLAVAELNAPVVGAATELWRAQDDVASAPNEVTQTHKHTPSTHLPHAHPATANIPYLCLAVGMIPGRSTQRENQAGTVPAHGLCAVTEAASVIVSAVSALPCLPTRC